MHCSQTNCCAKKATTKNYKKREIERVKKNDVCMKHENRDRRYNIKHFVKNAKEKRSARRPNAMTKP